MAWDFEDLKRQVESEAAAVVDAAQLEAFRIKYLGRKGLLPEIYRSLASASAPDKPLIGKGANELHRCVESALEQKKQSVETGLRAAGRKEIDVTLPGAGSVIGHPHLISRTIEDICALFERLGFVIHEGPEIESQENNFEALNIPADHPSRDGFDTFYLDQKDPKRPGLDLVLRSHTSPGQVRIMRQFKPPMAVIIPGRVYRPDAVDASHSFMFHQVEGLLVDDGVTFADLKGLLTVFCKKFFGEDIRMRFRPHFFPFTEPSAEVDISWSRGKKEWLEIMGCGMVHPNVFTAGGYPKDRYSGWAFGMGVERIAMLKHGVSDIRTFFENDQRFLEQFQR
jgi:phenylalanyl-tRNA synthetase alpha chain